MFSAMRAVQRFLSVATLLAVAVACSARSVSIGADSGRSKATVVSLDRIEDRSLRGLHNIFFDSVPAARRDSMHLGAEWRDVQVADVITQRGMLPVRVARFRPREGAELTYVIDTAGAGDFAHAPVLSFERRERLRITDIELTVRSTSGSARRVPYQILLADDGYTYARIADFRIGHFRLDGREYAVRVQNRGHGHPFYALNPGTEFLVDLNGDGQLADRASVMLDGRPVSAEQVASETPFTIGTHMFELAAIDSTGSWLSIRASTRAVAVADGRRAPEVVAKTLAGGVFRLSKQTGKVVLLEFWATDCRFSEQARSAANDVADKYGAKYVWVAIPNDTSRADIEQHLTKYPMRATVTERADAAWDTFNPRGATPAFVVIDQRGIVRFRAEGASAIGAVAAKIGELLEARP